VATIPLGGTLEFGAVDANGRLWVNDQKASEIVSIDIATRKVLGRYKLDGCEGPSGLAYAAAADRLVASCNMVAAVVDPASGKTVDQLAIGKGPDAVIYDPVRKRIFITAGQSGEMDVISASGPKLRVAQVVMTAPSARTGTVDPKTGTLYLPMAKMGPPAEGSTRPTPVPGSFELLVVGP
jgi:DNA-binding beta-propeller fold protein YncE